MKKEFRSFQDARKFVQALNLKGQQEWRDFSKSNKRPNNIPAHPERIYKKEWKNMGDWLGTGRIASKNIQFKTFVDARKFVQALNLKGQQEWRDFSKSNKRPDDIPTAPDRVYKKEWKSWGDWLGTGTIATKDIQYRSLEDARKFVKKLGLKGIEDWKKYCASGNKPDDIPSNPWRTYKK